MVCASAAGACVTAVADSGTSPIDQTFADMISVGIDGHVGRPHSDLSAPQAQCVAYH